MSSNGISNRCSKNGKTNFSVNVLTNKCSPPNGKLDEGDNCNFEDGRRAHGVDSLCNSSAPGGSLNGGIIAQTGEHNLSNHKNEFFPPQHLQENNFINMKEERARQKGRLNWGYPFKWNKKEGDPFAEKDKAEKEKAEKSGGVFSKMVNEYNSNQGKTPTGNGDVSPSNADRSNSTVEKIYLNGSGEMKKKKKKKSSICNVLNSNAQHWNSVVNGLEWRNLLSNGVEKSCPLSANKHSGKITPIGSGENDVSIETSHRKELSQGGRQTNGQEAPTPFFTSPIPKPQWKSDNCRDHLNGHSSIVSHTQNEGYHPFYMGKGKNCALKKRLENILLSDREEVIYVDSRNGGGLWGEKKKGGGFQGEKAKRASISERSSERSSTGNGSDDVASNTPSGESNDGPRFMTSGSIHPFPPNGWNDLMSKRARGQNDHSTNCPDVYTNGNMTHGERGYSVRSHKAHQIFMNHVKRDSHDKAIYYDMKDEKTFGDSNDREERNLTGKESLPVYVNSFNTPQHVAKIAPELGRNHVGQNGFLQRNDGVKTTKKDMKGEDNTDECLPSVHTNGGTYQRTFKENEKNEIVKEKESKRDGMKGDPHACVTSLLHTQSGGRENGCLLNHSFVKENTDGMSLLNGAKREGCAPAMEGVDKLDDGRETPIGGDLIWSRCPHQGNENPLRASKHRSSVNQMNGTPQGGEDNAMCHSMSDGASGTNWRTAQRSSPPPSHQKGEARTEKKPLEDKSIFNYYDEWMNRLEKGKDQMSNGEGCNLGSVYKEGTQTNKNGCLEYKPQSSHPIMCPPEKISPSTVTPNVGTAGKLPHLGKDGKSHTPADRRGSKEVAQNGDITKKKKQIFGFTPVVHPLLGEQTNEQRGAHHDVSLTDDPLSSNRMDTNWRDKKTRGTNSRCDQFGSEELPKEENKTPPQDNSPFFANKNGPHWQSGVDAKEEYTYESVSKWEEANRSETDNLSKWIYEASNLEGGLNFGDPYSMHASEQSLKRGEEILNRKMASQLANGVLPNWHNNNFVLRGSSYGAPHGGELSDRAPLSGVFFGEETSIWGGGNKQGRTDQVMTNQGRDIRSGADVHYLHSSGENGGAVPRSESKHSWRLGDDAADAYDAAEEPAGGSKDTSVNFYDDSTVKGYADGREYAALQGEEDLLGGMSKQQGGDTFDPKNDYRWQLCHLRYPEGVNFKKAFFFTFQNDLYIYGARKNNFVISDRVFRIREGEVEAVRTRGAAPKLYVKVYLAVEEGVVSGVGGTTGCPPSNRSCLNFGRIDQPRKRVYIWGANEKRQLDLYTLYRLDLCRLEWQEIRITYNRQLNVWREDFSLILVKDCLYMYGGVVFKGGEWICCDELWRCDTGRRKWEMLAVGAGTPEKGPTQEDPTQKGTAQTEGHSFCSLHPTKVVNLFASPGESSSLGSHLKEGQTNESDKATSTPCEEKQPGRRAGHLCVLRKNRMYIHGGTNLTEEKSDFYFFDLERKKWFEVVPRGEEVPSKRYGHCGVVIKNKLYIYGGFTKTLSGNSLHNDLFEYDFVENTWRQVFTIGDLIYLKRCLNGKQQGCLAFVKLLLMRSYYEGVAEKPFSSAEKPLSSAERVVSGARPGDWTQKGGEERLPNGETNNAAKSAPLEEDPHGKKLHANFIHIEETPLYGEAIIPQNIFRNKCLYFDGSLYLLGGCGLNNHLEKREESNFFIHYESVFKMKIGQPYDRYFAHYLSHVDGFFWDLIAKEEMKLHQWVQRGGNLKEDTASQHLPNSHNDFDDLWSQLNGQNETCLPSGEDACPKDAPFVINKIDHMLGKNSTGLPSGGGTPTEGKPGSSAQPGESLPGGVPPDGALPDVAPPNCADNSGETNLGNSLSLCQGKKMLQLLTWLVELYHSGVCADEMATASARGQWCVSNLLLEERPAGGRDADSGSPGLFAEGGADQVGTFKVSTFKVNPFEANPFEATPFNTCGEGESRLPEKKQGEPRPAADQEATNDYIEDAQGVRPHRTEEGTKEVGLNGERLQESNLPSDQSGKRDIRRCSAPLDEASKVDSLEGCPVGELPTARSDANHDDHNDDGEKKERNEIQPSGHYREGGEEGVGYVPPGEIHNENGQHVSDEKGLRFGGGGKGGEADEGGEADGRGEANSSPQHLIGRPHLPTDPPNNNHIYLNMEKSIIYNYLEQFSSLTDDRYSIKMKIRRNEIYKLIYTYTKSVEIQNSVCFKMLEELEGQARQLLAEKEHPTDGKTQRGSDAHRLGTTEGEEPNGYPHLPFSEDTFESLQNEHGQLKKKMKYFCDMAHMYSIKINKLILYIRILEQKYEYVMNCLLKLKSVLFRGAAKRLGEHSGALLADHSGGLIADHLAAHSGAPLADHLGRFFAEDTFFVHEQNANSSSCDYGKRADDGGQNGGQLNLGTYL
ncbi:hypothetical protein PVMG_04267 [Plasmodium vivax Mauritania I]|uniref:Kelch domain-containing protein n=1 Tax=Plasmodium vivax Mauritania I TaxID=1035515 RepID=A0A0J9TEJ2_PLAVI|nr:hypothetical protein PVMG_04267 [Plasmodium vivax Mauritania I]